MKIVIFEYRFFLFFIMGAVVFMFQKFVFIVVRESFRTIFDEILD